MKPIAVIQHEHGVTAGHFESWLLARGIPYEIVGVHCGVAVPPAADAYAGLCSLGGNMSVNDPLPWIRDELALLRDAVWHGVPVIGHCLGAQLLAAALGATVRRNRFKEMGWYPVDVEDEALVAEWLGRAPLGELFHWHGDAFELPAGARRLLSSPLTANQAFIVEREGVEHLGMQFHIEMTAELVLAWAGDPSAETEVKDELARNGGPGVQPPEEMRRDAESRTEHMKPLAWRLYDRWARGLKE
jgi:GMP synthase-like glutamine amidotransferase